MHSIIIIAMNPIPWILLALPKKYRKYGFLILFILTLPIGLALLISAISDGDIATAFWVILIVGLFLLGYWYSWKNVDK